MGKPVKRARDRYLKAHQEAEEEGSPDPAGAAKKAVNSIKRKLPAVTFSGEFSQRGNDHIITHSGLFASTSTTFKTGRNLKPNWPPMTMSRRSLFRRLALG